MVLQIPEKVGIGAKLHLLSARASDLVGKRKLTVVSQHQLWAKLDAARTAQLRLRLLLRQLGGKAVHGLEKRAGGAVGDVPRVFPADILAQIGECGELVRAKLTAANVIVIAAAVAAVQGKPVGVHVEYYIERAVSLHDCRVGGEHLLARTRIGETGRREVHGLFFQKQRGELRRVLIGHDAGQRGFKLKERALRVFARKKAEGFELGVFLALLLHAQAQLFLLAPAFALLRLRLSRSACMRASKASGGSVKSHGPCASSQSSRTAASCWQTKCCTQRPVS